MASETLDERLFPLYFFVACVLEGVGELCRAIIGSFRLTEFSCLFHLLKVLGPVFSWRPSLDFLPPWGRCARIFIFPRCRIWRRNSEARLRRCSSTLRPAFWGFLSVRSPLVRSVTLGDVKRRCCFLWRCSLWRLSSAPGRPAWASLSRCDLFRVLREAAAWCFPAPSPAICFAVRS